MNPLSGRTLDPAQIATLGTDLRRPECVLAHPEIPDGTGDVSLPNGLAFDADGNVLIANFGTKRIEHLTARQDPWPSVIQSAAKNLSYLDSSARRLASE
jgi:gluconolactonase